MSMVKEEIVISGISGKFPSSKNVAEFGYNLYNKVDMVDDSEKRWHHTNPNIPRRSGKIDDLDRFDATHFGVHHRQAHTMDPQGRVLLEVAYEAILDAGVNPKSLSGKKVGVYVGVTFNEADKHIYEVPDGYHITGFSRAMLANRISYSLNTTGPSYLLDTACSSSLYALDVGCKAILNGECESAIVAGSNLNLHPMISLQFSKLNMLANDAISRPFDKDSTGYLRAEAIVCVFLQKHQDAKRVYATVVHTKTNCDGYKEEGIFFPSRKMQTKLMEEFYDEIKFDKNLVDYVEAHATGTPAGDPEECGAIDDILARNRSEPLLIGSVKSNMGHSEPTSGLCSIAKMILAFQSKTIAPTLNFSQPRACITGLVEGRMKVVTETCKLTSPFVAINSSGFGGANAHVLIKGYEKDKLKNGTPHDQLPRLLLWSGRTEESCNVVLDDMEKQPLDTEFMGLMYNIMKDQTPSHIYRGYGLYRQELDVSKNAVCISRSVICADRAKKPLVFVFSGMGSQWSGGMGTSLMNIPIFRESIEHCHRILEQYGLDLSDIVTTESPTIFDNILHSFVGIAAVQIGLVDILRTLAITPDFILGHSVGELACAYADGCLTREEMILCAFSRGMASVETKVLHGSMAAIGLDYDNVKPHLLPGLEVACHNGVDSCTVSGPTQLVNRFVNQLKSQSIFAKEVPCANIAYHSKYIAAMGPNLLQRLQGIITNPRKRSLKWLSTSVPLMDWDLEQHQYCSAAYQTNNLLNPVLFAETMKLLPDDAVTLEIAPHGLLQAILRRSMPHATHIPLTQRNHENLLYFFLSAIGKAFCEGVNVDVEKFYPPTEFPVSIQTRNISPLMRWEHSDSWFVAKYDDATSERSERISRIKLDSDEYQYIAGHKIDGRVLLPATLYLDLVWKAFCAMNGTNQSETKVEMLDVRFLRATAITTKKEIVLNVVIQRGTGQFEIAEGQTAVVTGIVKSMESEITRMPSPPTDSSAVLKTKDIYKELNLRGYEYGGDFQSLLECSMDALKGRLDWKHNNFVVFIDCMMQFSLIAKDSRSLYLPIAIESIRIDPTAAEFAKDTIAISRCKYLNKLQAGGVEVAGLTAKPISRKRERLTPVLEAYKFIPYFPTKKFTDESICRYIAQLLVENTLATKIEAIEINESNDDLMKFMQAAFDDLPLVTCKLSITSIDAARKLGKVNLFMCSHLLSNSNLLAVAAKITDDQSFIVSRESVNLKNDNIYVPNGLLLVSSIKSNEETILIFKKEKLMEEPNVIKVSLTDKKFSWLTEVQKESSRVKVLYVEKEQNLNGLLGFVNCIRKEPNGNRYIGVIVDDVNALPFNIHEPVYSHQLRKGLAVNIYRKGKWGTYRHLKLNATPISSEDTKQCVVNCLNFGDLSTLVWQEGYLNTSQPNREVVQTYYSALNFRDVMLATGRITKDSINVSSSKERIDLENVLGMEFSGVTNNGKRVMGYVKSGALSTKVEANANFLFECPPNWSLEQAVTVPVVYSTVYYAFFGIARITHGKSILIHAGSGGVGLAAIHTAFNYGLDVYTTVSNDTKLQYLIRTFPQLKPSQIGCSRDTSFYGMVMEGTCGKGVDYVLNSLAEDKLIASVKCLGKGGQFLEIGKFDMENNTKLGLSDFIRELSFHSIMLDSIIWDDNSRPPPFIEQLKRDVETNVIKPLETTVFTAHDVEQAFRYLGSGRHVGKVVVKLREKDSLRPYQIQVYPKFYCNPTLSYIIVGGLGGFGLELADWLVLRGCKNLILSSTNGLRTPYQCYRISLWRSYGVNVSITLADATTTIGAKFLIGDAIQLAPVGGIFNLAVRLRDGVVQNQKISDFKEVLAPKAWATIYLDEASRRMCPRLEHFVVFSSVSCGRGNAGQTNYGMANAVMERVIEQRRSIGLPGKAIQWGAIGDVGLVAELLGKNSDSSIGGTIPQRISSCLDHMDKLLKSPEAIVSSMIVAEKKTNQDASTDNDTLSAIMNVMCIKDLKSISMDSKLSNLGMDSLMAVEIIQILERDFELFLSAKELRSMTFADLKSKTMKRDVETPRDSAFNLFFKTLGLEEDCHDNIISLPTKHDGPDTILIVPGIEGVAAQIWKDLSIKLELPSFLLQLRKTGHMTDPDLIAQTVLKDTMQMAFNKTHFYRIIGYSFGSLITLELAKYFEKQLGMCGTIVLIDGAPLFCNKIVQTIANTQGKFTETDAKKVFLQIMSPLVQGSNTEVLSASTKDWDTACSLLIKSLSQEYGYSKTYLNEVFDSVLSRIKIMSTVKEVTEPLIEADILLIRPVQAVLAMEDASYGLSKLTKGKVVVRYLEGNHSTILENGSLGKVINEALVNNNFEEN